MLFLSLPLLAAAAPCSPFVEEMPGGTTVSVRPHTDAFSKCPISEETYGSLIRGWLERRPLDAPPVSSVFLGRLVDYPWLSQALALRASEHPSWDARRGWSRDGDLYSLVRAILLAPAVFDRLQEPFAGSGLAVTGLSVEKVLVGRLGDVLPADSGREGVVPFDAMVWLLVKPVEGSASATQTEGVTGR